jgi:hypothetical protein
MFYLRGTHNNGMLVTAVNYLPGEILDEYEDKLAFTSVDRNDACRLARQISEKEEIIVLSERIFPSSQEYEVNLDGRYFIFAVLHEVAHAVKKHRSPSLDNLTVEEDQEQEKEADQLAMSWFNEHVKEQNIEELKPITLDEINRAKKINNKLMARIDKIIGEK